MFRVWLVFNPSSDVQREKVWWEGWKRASVMVMVNVTAILWRQLFYFSSRITLQALCKILLLWHVERFGRIVRYSKYLSLYHCTQWCGSNPNSTVLLVFLFYFFFVCMFFALRVKVLIRYGSFFLASWFGYAIFDRALWLVIVICTLTRRQCINNRVGPCRLQCTRNLAGCVRALNPQLWFH